jgi:hypothetical protein
VILKLWWLGKTTTGLLFCHWAAQHSPFLSINSSLWNFLSHNCKYHLSIRLNRAHAIQYDQSYTSEQRQAKPLRQFNCYHDTSQNMDSFWSTWQFIKIYASENPVARNSPLNIIVHQNTVKPRFYNPWFYFFSRFYALFAWFQRSLHNINVKLWQVLCFFNFTFFPEFALHFCSLSCENVPDFYLLYLGSHNLSNKTELLPCYQSQLVQSENKYRHMSEWL